ncbi:hypothetical protein MMPV_009047 [Pyropia vietnamensis]
MLLHVGLIIYDRYYTRRQLRLAEEVSTLPFQPLSAHESPAVIAASRAREAALAALPTRRGAGWSVPPDGTTDAPGAAATGAAALAPPVDGGSGGVRGGDLSLPSAPPLSEVSVAVIAAVAAAATATTAEDNVAADGGGDLDGATAGAPPMCAVCMGDLEAAEEVVVLPCGHAFHSGPSCVRAWLAFRDTCPTCRAPVASLVSAPLPRPRRPRRRRSRLPSTSATVTSMAASSMEASPVGLPAPVVRGAQGDWAPISAGGPPAASPMGLSFPAATIAPTAPNSSRPPSAAPLRGVPQTATEGAAATAAAAARPLAATSPRAERRLARRERRRARRVAAHSASNNRVLSFVALGWLEAAL